MNNSEELNKLAAELLKGFHIQFAENQRTREQSFLKIVGFLGAVVLGYAYAYQNLGGDSNNAFSYVAISSVVLLLFGSIVVTVIAYSFRRDQYENARIRYYAQVIGEGKPFPSGYNPYHIFKKKWAYVRWTPDIFGVFYLLFLIFQILVLISYSTRLHLSLSFSKPDTFATITVIVGVVCIIICLIILVAFGSKLKKKYEEWEKEYPISATNVPAANSSSNDAHVI
jgi:NADH:ubiquinone oxidoreductase subunit 3 (subunit A)